MTVYKEASYNRDMKGSTDNLSTQPYDENRLKGSAFTALDLQTEISIIRIKF